MEPLLELTDRITATVWPFLQVRRSEVLKQPDFSNSFGSERPPNLLNSEDALRKRAEKDYALLAQILDLYDPHRHQESTGKNPFDWITGDTFRNKIKAIREHWDWDPRHIRSAFRFTEKQFNRERRQAAGIAVTDLSDRIRTLEAVWMRAEISFGGAGPPSPASLLEYASAETSDELFDKIARWISSDKLTPRDRLDLAESFLRSPRDAKQALFLMEENIDEWTEKIDPPPWYGWLRRWRHHRCKTQGKSILTSPDRKCSAEDTALWWRTLTQQEKLELLLDRNDFRLLCRKLDVPVPFSIVFSDELEQIRAERKARFDSGPLDHDGPVAIPLRKSPSSGPAQPTGFALPQHEAESACLFGLALSGGGIRSATFALGLLQAMADRNILPYIDIVSAVSGGSYITSFLVAWIKRRGGIQGVQSSLRGFASAASCNDSEGLRKAVSDPLPCNQDPRADHLRPVRLLREYARYLAPEAGLFSADTWTIGTTWFRNTFLNLVVLLLFFAGVLSIPRALVIFLHISEYALHESGFLVVALLLPLIGFLIGFNNLRTLGSYRSSTKSTSRGWEDRKVLWRIVVPVLATGALAAGVIWETEAYQFPWKPGLGFALVFLLSMLVTWLSAKLRKPRLTSSPSKPASVLKLIFFSVLACGVSLFLMEGFCLLLSRFAINTIRGLWLTIGVGPALMMIVFVLAVLAMIGLSGTDFEEDEREWWSRLAAWLAICTVTWLLITTICFFAPLWILASTISLKSRLAATLAGISWLGIVTSGVKLAFSPKTANPQSDQAASPWTSWILKIAPVVFVLGLLCCASFVVFWLTNPLLHPLAGPLHWFRPAQDNLLCCTDQPFNLERLRADYWPLLDARETLLIALPGVLLLLSSLLAKRVDVNAFSMHNFYRNRLVRAYLGASRERAHRKPNAFTGFDWEDDLRLHRLSFGDPTSKDDLTSDCRASYRGPFPVLNTALNITKGQDLGLQERRAESFIFTPLWSGFDYMRKQSLVREAANAEFGFRRTDRFGKGGVHVGTAMAISGAAFSSNAGYHTSPPLAFLLTVFGVRLGWWAGNPREHKWGDESPADSLSYLAKELTAQLDTGKDFVLLTDGGHFENMGLYELVRRRCRYIIISDAEEDAKFKLEGIGGAVRKCRSDFGAVIDLNLGSLKPFGDPANSRLHFTVGTVRYPGAQSECGTIIYIKASLTGDESVDLVEFRQRHPEFPHTPTINQMFDESHFESYRELGHHIGSGVFEKDWPIFETQDFCQILADGFAAIKHSWKRQQDAAKAKHAAKSKP